MAFDDILKAIGEFGRYQKFVFILACIPSIFTAFQKFVWYFLILEPAYRCELPLDTMYNVTLPFEIPPHVASHVLPHNEKGEYDKCFRFAVVGDSTNVLGNWTTFSETLKYTNETEKCNKWVYDKSERESSISSEFDLVCDSQWQQKNGQIMYVVGELIAGFTTGHISDRFGRRVVIMTGIVSYILFGFLVACSTSKYILMLFRAFLGYASACIYLTCFVVVTEVTTPQHRLGLTVSVNYFFALGYLLVLPFGYFILNWRTLQAAVTLPSFALLSYYWFMPESPRWLVSQNRTIEAKLILEKTAEKNKTTLPENCFAENLQKQEDCENHETITPLTLMKYPKLRVRSLICFYQWFVASGVYYGLTLNTDVGGNQYIKFLISAALEFVGTGICHIALNRTGRKPVLCAATLITGLSLLITAFIPQENVTVLVALTMIGRLAINVSFVNVYVIAGEIFPTVARSTGLGMSSFSARVGSISMPYVSLLKDYWMPLPFIVYGSQAILAAVLALFLPETKGKRLPETIDDIEELQASRQQLNEIESKSSPTNEKY